MEMYADNCNEGLCFFFCVCAPAMIRCAPDAGLSCDNDVYGPYSDVCSLPGTDLRRRIKKKCEMNAQYTHDGSRGF